MEAYVAHGSTMRTLKLFPSVGQWMTYEGLDPNQNYACFLIDNDAGSPDMAENIWRNNMLVRTRTDSYPWRADEWEAEAMVSGAFILTTDFPPREVLGEESHVVTFDGGGTVESTAKRRAILLGGGL